MTIKKMKSQNGASLFLALMFFLICSLTGSAILTIARSYERRTAANRESEAEYLAALSAAEFLKGQLKSCAGTWSLCGDGIDSGTENKVQEELLETLGEFCKEYRKHPVKAVKEMRLEIVLEDDMDDKDTDRKRNENRNEIPSVPAVKVEMVFEPGDEAEGEENEFEEDGKYLVPVHIKAELFLEDKNRRSMSLSVAGTILYEEETEMEVDWGKMEIGR